MLIIIGFVSRLNHVEFRKQVGFFGEGDPQISFSEGFLVLFFLKAVWFLQ